MGRRSVFSLCLFALVLCWWGTAKAETPGIAAGGSHTLARKTELRDAIDVLRIRNGLGAFGWNDISLTPGSSPIRRQHLLDLRTALDAAYTEAQKTHTPYAESITVGVAIKASHLGELRSFVRGLE